MRKYRLKLSYLGTPFCGWQKQRGSAALGGPSIQETIEDALFRVTEERTSVVGSGRTDAGVHATGQVAHFVLERENLTLENLRRGMNSLMPPEIRVLSVEEVPIEFHAQRSATGKRYSYYIQQGSCPLPHLMAASWWIHRPLDLDKMQKALGLLVGTHEFGVFQASGGMVRETQRTITTAKVSRIDFQSHIEATNEFWMVRITVEGNGFLKQMIRSIVGTLVEVGEGRREAECFKQILEKQERGDLGGTAPARGLFLERVDYV